MIVIAIVLNVILLSQGTQPLLAPNTPAPVLVDGRCEGAEWSRASRRRLTSTSELLLQQHSGHLYLCVTLPPDSYGTMDLYVSSKTTAAPINLHASAQVGERQRTDAGWPAWVFGNHRDWYSPPNALMRVEANGDRPRLTFSTIAAREVVIDKAKFGSGPWRFMIQIRAMGIGKEGALTYPAAASPDDESGWESIRL